MFKYMNLNQNIFRFSLARHHPAAIKYST